MLLLFYSVSEGGGICDMSSPRLSIPDNWWAVSFVSILLISACTENELLSIMRYGWYWWSDCYRSSFHIIFNWSVEWSDSLS